MQYLYVRVVRARGNRPRELTPATQPAADTSLHHRRPPPRRRLGADRAGTGAAAGCLRERPPPPPRARSGGIRRGRRPPPRATPPLPRARSGGIRRRAPTAGLPPRDPEWARLPHLLAAAAAPGLLLESPSMAAAAAPPAARSHNWSNLVVTFSYPSCSNASQQAQTKAEGNSATSPTDEMFRDALDLHKFVRNALPDRALEIADTIIWLHGQTQDNIATSRIQECLVSVFVLGISCSKQQPQERPSIRDAAIEMHAIRDVYLEFVG